MSRSAPANDLQGRHLVLQLAQDQGGAPAQGALAHVHVAEHVVAHVQDLVPLHAQVPLHLGRAAAHVGAARAQRPQGRAQQPVAGDHLEERRVGGEEFRLAGADDDQVEQVPPGGALGQERVERVGHHGGAEVPVGIGDEQQLLAGAALVQEGERDLRVQHHAALRLGDDLGLEPAFQVLGVHHRPHLAVQVPVAHGPGQRALVQQVHQLGVEAALGQGEQGVEEHPAGVRQVHQGAGGIRRPAGAANSIGRVPCMARRTRPKRLAFTTLPSWVSITSPRATMPGSNTSDSTAQPWSRKRLRANSNTWRSNSSTR